MKIKNAFTLIELIVSIGVLAVMLLGATAILYRSLSSGGFTDIDSTVLRLGRQFVDTFERSVKFSQVLAVMDGVDVLDRSNCSDTTEGVTGDGLRVVDSLGATTEYTLYAGTVASNSSEMITSSELLISNLQFTWVCTPGASDKLKMAFDVTTVSNMESDAFTRHFEKTITLLNSGI